MRFYIEIKRFIKNNYKQFLVIVFGVLFLLVITLFGLEYFSNNVIEDDVDSSIQTEVFTYQFDFFIENIDGTNFNNPSILKESIILTSTLDEVEEDTGAELSNKAQLEDLVKSSNDELNIDSSDIEYYFDISRDSNSGRYSFLVSQTSPDDSLDAINIFFDLISNQELEVLENKDVTVLSTPYLIEEDSTIDIAGSDNSYLTIRYILLSIFASLIIASLVVICKEYFSNTINYYFSYDADKFEYFSLIDRELINTESISSLLKKNKTSLLVKDNEKILSEELQFIDAVDDLDQINNLESIDEIIILVHPFKTRRKWFKKQLSILRWHNICVRVIQLNDIEG